MNAEDRDFDCCFKPKAPWLHPDGSECGHDSRIFCEYHHRVECAHTHQPVSLAVLV